MKRESNSDCTYQAARWLLVIIGVAMLVWLGSAQPAVAQGPTPPGTPPQSGALLSECLGSGEATSSYHAQTGKLRFVGTAPGKPLARSAALPQSASPESAARAYLSMCGSLFGLRDQSSELTVERQRKSDRGRSMVRFHQTHQGIPVVGGELIVNLDSAKNIVSVSGEILPTISVKTAPAVNAATAQRNALQAVAKKYQLSADALTAIQPKLWIYNPTLIRPGGGFTTLVWRMEVTPKNLGPIRELVLIDAQRGSVALSINQMDTARNRETYTANNGTSLPGILVCNESNPTCTGGDSHAVAAHTYAGDTYDFYFNYHGRDSINNVGMTLRSTVHYGSNYQNAFWNGSQMVYGDGYGFALADDVVAHELTHGVTDYESNLFYYYQSGAINESFSDVWGEFVDLTNGRGNDDPSVRWLLGEDISDLGAIRNMQNPPAFSDPDKMTSTYYYTSSGDNGGVHTNSGVNNKAVYLMTDGGTFNGQTITGLGITKVAKIYYEVQTNLLTSGSDYADLYDALYQGCTNLIGTSGITSNDCQQVRNATIAVEMNQQPVAGYNPDAPVCASGQTPANLFFDNVESGSGNWTFGALSGTSRWGRVSGYAHSGTYSLYGDDYPAAVSDSYAAMNTSVTLPANAYLHFAHAYGFQDPNYDGGVLEYSTNGGTSWSDAGSLFDYNGYKGTLSSSFGNPLGGRSAFIGDSHGYYSSRLNLNPLVGQSVRFRWGMGTDISGYDLGWLVDDVRVYTCSGTPPPCYSLTTNVSPSGSGSVSASPAPNCGSQYTSETIVTLTANANTGYVFSNWSGDASGSSKTTTVTMIGIKNVTANFTASNWAIKASMSVARSRAAVAAVNGKVYVIGGESAATGFQSIQGDSTVRENVTPNAWERTTEEYNPATNTWASKATKPTGVSNIGAGVINNKIYVPGGYNGTSAVSVVEVYDPATNTWSTVASLPTAQYAHAVVAVNNKLYVMGGYTGSIFTNTCYVYDPSSNSWSSCAPMAYTRGYAGAGVVNGKIYVVGGRDASTVDFNYVEEYNPTTNTWQTRAPMGTARGGPGAVGVGNYLYICGGGWSTYLASCERYNPTTNTWSAFQTMNVGRRTLGLVEANGKLYAEAGYKGTYSADNEENALTTCYTLTTNVSPSGSGSVNTSPAPNCSTQYTSGTAVTLTANANTGYTLSSWSGDASGSSNPTTVTMNANKTVTANFQQVSPTQRLYLPFIRKE